MNHQNLSVDYKRTQLATRQALTKLERSIYSGGGIVGQRLRLRYVMARFSSVLFLGAFVALAGGATAEESGHATVLVLDASGSMWEQLEDGKSRIEIARDVIAKFDADRNAELPVGLVAYGHNRRGDCEDIETVLPVERHAAGELGQTVAGLDPQGKTPLTEALSRARGMIPDGAESADLVLVTDGLENCGGDPCELAQSFAAEGISLRAHVVGFALEAEAAESLACLPRVTGGELFTTQSGAELAAALEDVADFEPRDVDVRLESPGQVVAGTTFDVSVDGAGKAKDYLVIASRDDDERVARYDRISNQVDGDGRYDYTAPSDPGQYELRYYLERERRLVARREIEVIEAGVRLEGPAQVSAGERFEVAIEGGIPGHVVVVHADRAADDLVSRYERMRNSVEGDEGRIERNAPETPGRYAVRYHAEDDRRVLTEIALEVVD